jgi:rRNA-processing protein FCF1
MTREELEDVIYERTRYFVEVRVMDCILELIAAEREAEREACAEIADSQIKNLAVLAVNPGKSAAAWDIANAIRARGSKT